MIKTFEILNFEHWDLFEICDLKFGIYAIKFSLKSTRRPIRALYTVCGTQACYL